MKAKRWITIFILLALPVGLLAGHFEHPKGVTNDQDSSNIVYEIYYSFGWGGDSKLALFLPKFYFTRKHQFEKINFYYGGGLGLHALFLGPYGSISGALGVEKNTFDLETSISHFRIAKAKRENNEREGPFSQNLFNLKLGMRIKTVRVKVGTSFILGENSPLGQEPPPLLNFGKIGNNIWSIELQLKLK